MKIDSLNSSSDKTHEEKSGETQDESRKMSDKVEFNASLSKESDEAEIEMAEQQLLCDLDHLMGTCVRFNLINHLSWLHSQLSETISLTKSKDQLSSRSISQSSQLIAFESCHICLQGKKKCKHNFNANIDEANQARMIEINKDLEYFEENGMSFYFEKALRNEEKAYFALERSREVAITMLQSTPPEVNELIIKYMKRAIENMNKDEYESTLDRVSRKLIEHQILSEEDRLVSFNDMSAYTNIPVQAAIQARMQTLGEDPENMQEVRLSIASKDIILYLLMSSSYFTFDSKYNELPQILAMGSCLAPILANNLMAELEEHYLEQTIPTPKLWVRCMHDYSVIWPHEKRLQDYAWNFEVDDS
ncbi:unnamed protein product [Protopolystoma xenopodis]|uniref:Uncharacterized protein n=1 Tax=Protopolystoma xenopodis TaxID=117903 RepID=A0A3S4ZS69_9PLAT|nr:unnamed protein product [Protopolystoma xenopodis]